MVGSGTGRDIVSGARGTAVLAVKGNDVRNGRGADVTIAIGRGRRYGNWKWCWWKSVHQPELESLI
jgi:hypothetical protein